MIEYTACEPHYLDHLAPIHRKTGGTFWVPRRLLDHAVRRGVDAAPYDATPPFSGPVVIASKKDHHLARDLGCDVVHVPHGNAQSFSGQHPGYTGGPGFERVRLFLCPNQQAADLWRNRYPDTPTEVVGCPKLDDFLKVPAPGDGTVAISFHWDAKARRNPVPETWTAWPYYDAVLPELAKRFKLIGHAHPRIFERLAERYREIGIEPVADFEEVVARADLYINDCSSTLYEFAALDRPVVVLNTPDYRRNVRHGMRFWEFADVGVQCDDPDSLAESITEAFEDRNPKRRREIVAQVYPWLGESATRAAIAISNFKPNPPKESPAPMEPEVRRYRNAEGVKQSAYAGTGLDKVLSGSDEWEEIHTISSPAPEPPPDLSGFTRPELNQLAIAAGYEHPEHLPNKAAVIEAIEAAEVARG